MSSREKILKKLWAAQKADAAGAENSTPASSDDQSVFKDYPVDEDLSALFKSRIEALNGEFYKVKGIQDAAEVILELVQAAQKGACIAQNHNFVQSLLAAHPVLQECFRTLPDSFSNLEFEHAAVGLTVADALIARTGSIALNTVSAGGRRLSVLPPFHIVLATQNQLVPSMQEALAKLHETESWSYATFITGPSRTADIQKNLVLGAHGPKRLAVVCVEDASSSA